MRLTLQMGDPETRTQPTRTRTTIPGWTTTTTTTTTTTIYGPLSGTTRVSWYQKKHSPTHLSWSPSNLYQLLPSTTIHSTLPVQFTCLTIFLHKLSPSLQVLFGLSLGLEHSISYSIHFFTRSVSSFHSGTLQAMSHFHVSHYFTQNCCTASLS